MNIIVCGLDRVGKDTLIKNLLKEYGYHPIIHSTAPPKFNSQLETITYQRNGIIKICSLLSNDNGLIFNRAHLGEFVYSPLYRNYSGAYVFDEEKRYCLDDYNHNILLMLIDERDNKHFEDDGKGFSPEKRDIERELFIGAYNASCIKNKLLINVTNPVTKQFKSEDYIFNEVKNFISRV